MNPDVWIVLDLDQGSRNVGTFETQREAEQLAIRLVGNNAAARCGEIILYGPGDGTTSVMVRRWPREWLTTEEIKPA
jgi:hypothetical protein